MKLRLELHLRLHLELHLCGFAVAFAGGVALRATAFALAFGRVWISARQPWGGRQRLSLSLSLSLSFSLSFSLSLSLLFFFRAVVFLFVGMHSICCVVFEHSEHMSSNKIGVCMLDVFLDDVQMDQCVLCFASLKVLCSLFCKFLRGK